MTPLRFAVIGDPVAHSKSPVMHAAALRALGLPHTYEAVRVTAGELPSAIVALRQGTFAGLNVTIPHKLAVLPLVDEVHDSARLVGAANTLVRTAEGRVVAYNTDVPGLTGELDALAGPAAPWTTRRALVLGSGGAARAAVTALAALGVTDLAVRARRPGARLGGFAGVTFWQPWRPSPASEQGTFVVVQATSAGMTGADPGAAASDAVAWDALPADAVVMDVVYAPPDTPFLETARRRGLRYAGGLTMLARQGALALELWLGAPAPLKVMIEAIRSPGPAHTP